MDYQKGNILLSFSDVHQQKWINEQLNYRYNLLFVNSQDEAEKKLKEKAVDLVLIDVDCKKMDGCKIVRHIRHIGKHIEILLIGNSTSIKDAIGAMKIRAKDCIKKPFHIDHIVKKIHLIFEAKNYESGLNKLSKTFENKFIFENMVGSDKKIRKAFELIQKYSETDGTVLIQGESGTGKELAARAIHSRSPRKKGPFVVVNCAALPSDLMARELFGNVKGAFTGADISRPGKIETANGGTVFFDDIDSLDIYMQAKLLRLIQEKEFEKLGSTNVMHADVRFIAATNRDLAVMVEDGLFREDLYYRLNVLPITMPALRERKKDIRVLLKHFLRIYTTKTGQPLKRFSDSALQMMNEYEWPGNVRELKNLVERVFTISKGYVIGFHEVSTIIKKKQKGSSGSLKDMLQRFEKECILKALEWADWNRKKAAKKLGIHRNTLLNKINSFRFKKQDEDIYNIINRIYPEKGLKKKKDN